MDCRLRHRALGLHVRGDRRWLLADGVVAVPSGRRPVLRTAIRRRRGEGARRAHPTRPRRRPRDTGRHQERRRNRLTMATPAAASRRRRGRVRDIAWLVVAAILGLLFVLTITDGVVAVVLGHWADVAGLPITLLLSGWGAGGAWRRTSWGAEQRAGTARRRLIDVRGFMLFLPNGYESYARRDDTDVVIALRSVIVMITLVLGSFGSTLATVMAASNGAVLPWIGLIAALAIASFASCTFITTRPLDCTSDAS